MPVKNKHGNTLLSPGPAQWILLVTALAGGSCAAMPFIGPYAGVSAAQISLGCRGDFRIYEHPQNAIMLVAPYTATQVVSTLCRASGSAEDRAVAAVQEHFAKTNRPACRTNEPRTVALGPMVEVPFQCPPKPTAG
jgi:hypothetical protein